MIAPGKSSKSSVTPTQHRSMIFSAFLMVRRMALKSLAPLKALIMGIIVCAPPAMKSETKDRQNEQMENAARPSLPAVDVTIMLKIQIFANMSAWPKMDETLILNMSP